MRKCRTLAGAAWLMAAGGLLQACQPMPVESVRPAGSFTAAQRAALEREGFSQVGDNYELGLENRVLFDFDKSELRDDTRAMLARLGAVLTEVGIHGAMVEGHTDAEGGAAYNQRLSEKRALAVRDALVAAGLDAGSMRVWGAGERDPVASNRTADGRMQNRRVVIVVTPGDAIPLD